MNLNVYFWYLFKLNSFGISSSSPWAESWWKKSFKFEVLTCYAHKQKLLWDSTFEAKSIRFKQTGIMRPSLWNLMLTSIRIKGIQQEQKFVDLSIRE